MTLQNVHPPLKLVLLIGGIGFASYWLSSAIYSTIMRRIYTERRKRKQSEKAQAKASFAAYLEAHPMPLVEVLDITSLPYMQLIEALKTGELSPEKVLLAYQHKAFEVDQLCNCVIEFLYPDLSDVNLSGPFAGAPISLKDSISVKGCESYAGMACFLTGPAEEDSVLVTALKSLGAVPFVRTAVPQAMLSVLSSNPIDGTTYNPLDTSRSPGGSSSGEAALIAGGGSGLGFGTDLGGSVRLPAAMCNIVGFKPTSARLSQRRMFGIGRFMTIPSSVGPLARDVDTCIAAMKFLCDSESLHVLDYFNPPLTYAVSVPKEKKLKIGYFTFDGSYRPVPAARRAVLHVKDKLEAIGHQLIPWTPPFSGEEWFTIFLTALHVDGGKPFVEMLQYDELEPSMAGSMRVLKVGGLRRYLRMLSAKVFGIPEDLILFRALMSVSDIPTLAQHMKDLRVLRQRMYDHWNAASLDAVICPAFGMAAPIPVRTNRKFSGMLSYLNLFNITDMPAGCLPSGIKVSEEDIRSLKVDKESYISGSRWHQTAYDLQLDSVGFHVSVQVASAPWRDDLCLHVMKLVEEAVQSGP